MALSMTFHLWPNPYLTNPSHSQIPFSSAHHCKGFSIWSKTGSTGTLLIVLRTVVHVTVPDIQTCAPAAGAMEMVASLNLLISVSSANPKSNARPAILAAFKEIVMPSPAICEGSVLKLKWTGILQEAPPPTPAPNVLVSVMDISTGSPSDSGILPKMLRLAPTPASKRDALQSSPVPKTLTGLSSSFKPTAYRISSTGLRIRSVRISPSSFLRAGLFRFISPFRTPFKKSTSSSVGAWFSIASKITVPPSMRPSKSSSACPKKKSSSMPATNSWMSSQNSSTSSAIFCNKSSMPVSSITSSMATVASESLCSRSSLL